MDPVTVPAAGGPVTTITPDNPADDVRPRYSPDGAAIVYGAQTEPFFYADRVKLVRYDRKARTHVELCAGWDRSVAAWEFDGAGSLVLQAEDAARMRLWRVPALGEQMKVYQLSRLYRTVGMLLRAGIPAVRSLDMGRDLLAAHLRPQLAAARRLIEEGRLMSAAFCEAGLATPVAARMMAVGERSGDMGEMMGKIASFHDEEIARSNHFTVCDPLTDPDSGMVGRLTGLAERTQRMG